MTTPDDEQLRQWARERRARHHRQALKGALAVGLLVLAIGIVLLLASETTTPMSYVWIAAAVLFWASVAYATEMIRLTLFGRD